MALIRRTTPDFPSLQSFFNNFFENDDMFGRHLINRDITPAVNVREADDHFEIDVAAPGLKKEDFNVSISNGQLIVSAEHKEKDEDKGKNFMRKEFSYASFQRAFALPDNVHDDDVSARYEDGILKIELKKREDQAQQDSGKRIEIH